MAARALTIARSIRSESAQSVEASVIFRKSLTEALSSQRIRQDCFERHGLARLPCSCTCLRGKLRLCCSDSFIHSGLQPRIDLVVYLCAQSHGGAKQRQGTFKSCFGGLYECGRFQAEQKFA